MLAVGFLTNTKLFRSGVILKIFCLCNDSLSIRITNFLFTIFSRTMNFFIKFVEKKMRKNNDLLNLLNLNF